MTYSPEIEQAMRSFYDSLSEKDRRRYAAIEVAKLGHGGVESIASVLGCDPKTIRHGQHDLGHLPDDLGERVRQKGGTQAVHRGRAASGGELLAGGEGLHRR